MALLASVISRGLEYSTNAERKNVYPLNASLAYCAKSWGLHGSKSYRNQLMVCAMQVKRRNARNYFAYGLASDQNLRANVLALPSPTIAMPRITASASKGFIGTSIRKAKENMAPTASQMM